MDFVVHFNFAVARKNYFLWHFNLNCEIFMQ